MKVVRTNETTILVSVPKHEFQNLLELTNPDLILEYGNRLAIELESSHVKRIIAIEE